MDDPQSSSSKGNDKEPAPVGHRRRTYLVGILLTASALIVAWIFIRGPLTRYLRESRLPAPAGETLRSSTPEANGEPVAVVSFLSPGTVLFESLEADLDGDGFSEPVLIFNDKQNPYGPGMGGAVVLEDKADGSYHAYEHRPPSEGTITDAAIRDINRDEILELLIFKSSEDETDQYLCIYQWDGSDFVTLGPHGGPLDGEEAFASMFYLPEFKDVDMDGDHELLVYEDQPAYDRLGVLVYVWNGEAFGYDSLYIILGPQRPAAESG
jgi:hypothetical protein